MAKRDREKSLQTKRKEKEEKRAQRKGEKDDRTSIPAGEDPNSSRGPAEILTAALSIASISGIKRERWSLRMICWC